PPSQHLRRKRDDLEEAFCAKFTRHRSKNSSPDRLVLVIDQYRRVVIKADVAAVGPAYFLTGANDYRPRDFALLDLGVGYSFLDRHHDNVTHRGVTPA